MVGAVGLTLKRPVSAPNVDVFAQHNVDFQKVVVQIPELDSAFAQSNTAPHKKSNSFGFTRTFFYWPKWQ